MIQDPDVGAIAAAAAARAIEAREALPVPVVIVAIVGFFAVVLYAMKKIGGLKPYLSEPPFPTHAATVVAGIAAFTGFAFVATCRLALGMRFPDGYDGIMFLIGSVLGVVGAWGVGKRATSSERDAAKTTAALAVSAAQAGQGVPPTQVNKAPPQNRQHPPPARATTTVDPPGEGD